MTKLSDAEKELGPEVGRTTQDPRIYMKGKYHENIYP